jgi:hypothetical protein
VNPDLESARVASRGRSKHAACVEGTGERGCGVNACADASAEKRVFPAAAAKPRDVSRRRAETARWLDSLMK